MPELPEVETTVSELKEKIIGRKITHLWSDTKKLVKRPKNFSLFEKEIKKGKILDIKRKGKNILIEIDGKILLIHLKLTGHLLYGKFRLRKGKWEGEKGFLKTDPANRFIHLLFFLDNGKMLALSDLRKFAKIELGKREEILNSPQLLKLGPDPLDKKFNFSSFKERLERVKKDIKRALMDQKIISGIGNIYSDEILFEAKVHPLKKVKKLSQKELKKIFFSMKKILKKAILAKGESISDYRRPTGEKGGFDRLRKVYRRENQSCKVCQTLIKRIKIGGRSSYFCPKCQKR